MDQIETRPGIIGTLFPVRDGSPLSLAVFGAAVLAAAAFIGALFYLQSAWSLPGKDSLAAATGRVSAVSGTGPGDFSFRIEGQPFVFSLRCSVNFKDGIAAAVKPGNTVEVFYDNREPWIGSANSRTMIALSVAERPVLSHAALKAAMEDHWTGNGLIGGFLAAFLFMTALYYFAYAYVQSQRGTGESKGAGVFEGG